MADDDCKDDIRIDQDRLIQEIRSFSTQSHIMSVAAKGLARPLLDQHQSARRFEALRAEARYGKGAAQTRARQQQAEAAATLRATFEADFVSDLAERPVADDKQSGVYGTVTRSGAPQSDLQVGLLNDKGQWVGYGCTDAYGAYSFTFPAGRSGTLRVQQKDGATLHQDPAALAGLGNGQTLRRDIELDASEPDCPPPGPVDDDEEPDPVTTKVPELLGLTEDDATRRLRESNLVQGSRTQKPGDAEDGTVLEQSPKAGTEVAQGSAVDIVVASAPQQQRMPNVTDIPLSLALEVLKSAALSNIREQYEDVPDRVGIVLAQEPEPGAPIGPDTGVTLFVGRDSSIIMPQLIRQTVAEARAMLRDIGLTNVTVQERREPKAVGLVIAQSPESGQTVDRDTQVLLAVGIRGKTPETDFDGASVLEAMARDPAIQRRKLSADRLAQTLEPSGEITEERVSALAKMTNDEFVTATNLGNRAMATDIWRALRKTMTP